MHVKKGDTVKVIAGRDKGSIGEVVEAYPQQQKVLIKNVNVVRKHLRPTQQNQRGGVVDVEKPIHVSNVTKMG